MNFIKRFSLPLVYLFLVLCFLILGFFIVTYAAGYSFDFNSRKLLKTGLISIQVDTPNVEIYLNDKRVAQKSTVLRNLPEGTYELSVKKEGFNSWHKNIKLDEQEALIIGNIVLFSSNPKIETYSAKIKPENLSSLSDQTLLYSNGSEIFVQNDLVTRLSSDVSGLSWYPDQKHIAFTSNGQLNIIDSDGTNLISILKKDSATPVFFTNSGEYVVYENNKKILRAKIR